MLRILFVSLCLTVSLHLLFGSGIPEAQELSSAITPPTSPVALVGTATYFAEAPGAISPNPGGGFYVYVDKNSSTTSEQKPLLYPRMTITGGTTATTYIYSTIFWSQFGTSTAGSNFNTCTINLTSVPPGPLYVYLSNNDGSAITGNVMIDSQSIVITKDSYPSWFPTTLAPAQTYTQVRLDVDGTWYVNTSSFVETGAYSSLQYYPNGVTISYQ